jgi:hypothetical protein
MNLCVDVVVLRATIDSPPRDVPGEPGRTVEVIGLRDGGFDALLEKT